MAYPATLGIAAAARATLQRGTQSPLITRHVVIVISWWRVVTVISWRCVVTIRRPIPLAVMPVVPTRFPTLMSPPPVLLAAGTTVVAIVAAIPVDWLNQRLSV